MSSREKQSGKQLKVLKELNTSLHVHANRVRLAMRNETYDYTGHLKEDKRPDVDTAIDTESHLDTNVYVYLTLTLPSKISLTTTGSNC